MADEKNEIKLIGKLVVESGLIWVGDPCYFVGQEERNDKEFSGKTWQEFTKEFNEGPVTTFKYRAGHEGLGACLKTLDGTGVYDVYELNRRFVMVSLRSVDLGLGYCKKTNNDIDGLDFRVIGYAGVDAAKLWIGDPRYFVEPKVKNEGTFNSWNYFIGYWDAITTFEFDSDDEGLGVLIDVDGDGMYEIYGLFEKDSDSPAYLLVAHN